jgi:hypothetical protein
LVGELNARKEKFMATTKKKSATKKKVAQRPSAPKKPKGAAVPTTPKNVPVRTKQKAAAQAVQKKAPAKKEPNRAKSEMSILDAADKVLGEAKKPMRCKAMIEQMAARGYWTSNGKTPAATLYSAIFREIKEKGQEGPILFVGSVRFAGNPALISNPDGKQGSMVRFSEGQAVIAWKVTGELNIYAELALQYLGPTPFKQRPRTIWHDTRVLMQCNNGKVNALLQTNGGSIFPSRRVWINHTAVNTYNQGPFASLWNSNPLRPNEVK